MATPRSSRRRSSAAGTQPVPPRRKWRAITLATLALVPAYWSLMAGLVSVARDQPADPEAAGPDPAAALAFGLAVVPFVFILLAFLSEHPRAPGAVLRAMGLSLVVGIPASVVAADAVTGIVAGVGAGGICALRMEDAHNWRSRALGVLVVSLYTLVLVRVAGAVALLPAPVLPFTAIGVADHLSERRREQEDEADRA